MTFSPLQLGKSLYLISPGAADDESHKQHGEARRRRCHDGHIVTPVVVGTGSQGGVAVPLVTHLGAEQDDGDRQAGRYLREK